MCILYIFYMMDDTFKNICLLRSNFLLISPIDIENAATEKWKILVYLVISYN